MKTVIKNVYYNDEKELSYRKFFEFTSNIKIYLYKKCYFKKNEH